MMRNEMSISHCRNDKTNNTKSESRERDSGGIRLNAKRDESCCNLSRKALASSSTLIDYSWVKWVNAVGVD